MKKALLMVGTLLGVVVLGGVAVMVSTFGGLKPLPSGADLPSGARLVKDGYVALFVLPAGDGVALIDCGNDPTGAALLAELSREGKKADDVRAIFLTHGHPDHTAACHLFPKADVYAFAPDAPIAEGLERSKGPMPRRMDMPTEKRIKVSKLLKDGEDVAVGPLVVRPYSVPGHTGGSASFLSGGVLFMGDNATAESGGTLRPAPWVFSDDPQVNQGSLKALSKRLKEDHAEVKLMAYSHSGTTPGSDALDHF